MPEVGHLLSGIEKYELKKTEISLISLVETPQNIYVSFNLMIDWDKE